MNLNVDSFSRIDYSDNESVNSVGSMSSVASISSQLSTAWFLNSNIECLSNLNMISMFKTK